MIIFKKKTDAEIAATPAKAAPAPAEGTNFTPVPKAEGKGKKGKKTSDDDTLL